MLDDIRDHKALPTPEEEEWMAMHEIGTIARGILLAVVALAIGWSASALLDDAMAEQVAAMRASR